MTYADFDYAPADIAQNGAGLPLAASIFVERESLRRETHEDVLGAGLHVLECAGLSALTGGAPKLPGDVVLVDCPQATGAAIAALARLDMRAHRSGARLIISTTMDALEAVFACCDQSGPQLLIEPQRGERIVALGMLLAKLPGNRVKELAENDRLVLLRLTEQVGRIAEQLESFGQPSHTSTSAGAFRFESSAVAYAAPREGEPARVSHAPRVPLPDPRMIRRIIRQRQMRARFFDKELFADPAWDILLDLAAARAEHTRVSVTSLCIASGVPPTTALRWISQMTCAGWLERVEDESDRRRAFIALSDKAADAVARYFAEVGRTATHLV